VTCPSLVPSGEIRGSNGPTALTPSGRPVITELSVASARPERSMRMNRVPRWTRIAPSLDCVGDW
jgi:hypothetical protein